MPDDNRQPTAGTPEADDRDAALDAPTTGTPPEDDRDAGDGSGEDQPTPPEHLIWKQKAERVNAVEEENRRLREQLEVGHQPAADIGRQEQEIANLEARRPRLMRLAEAGDEAAAATLDLIDENIRMREEFVNAFHLQNVPDKRRAQVWATWQKDQQSARPRFQNIAEVNAAYERRDLNDENKKLREENERLKAGKNGKPQVDRDGVVRTTGSDRPAPPNATKPKEMTRDEYRQKKAALYEAGDDRAAREMDMNLRAGKIALKR